MDKNRITFLLDVGHFKSFPAINNGQLLLPGLQWFHFKIEWQFIAGRGH